jgi:hypothetical protein
MPAIPTGRVLFIDASLNHRRLAKELRARGRAARGAGQEGLERGVDDEQVLRTVAARFEDAVIVTADDHMPEEWAAVIEELGSTIAIVAPRSGPQADLYATDDHWERDIVHQWASVMTEQERSTVRRFWPGTHVIWTPLR